MLLASATASAAAPMDANGDANGAAAPDAVTLDRLEVTVARVPGVAAFELPASITEVTLDGSAARAGNALSEALDGIPGVAARERQNLAQDTQLSIRGFGARSTFGVRGLRVFVDGIPATMPDGQGAVSHVSMAGAGRIEVMRGPFSALYGNSSGGVIQVHSAEGEGAPSGHAMVAAGRDDARTASASLRGGGDRIGYALAGSHFETDGWRDHSAARRESLNALVRVALPGDARLSLVANHFDAPDAQDPLGLTWAQVQQDPRQATSVAHQYDTRKTTRQGQLGLRLDQPLAAGHALALVAHGGRREVEQFLAIPPSAQANPLNAGGNIDLDGRFHGADLRWQWDGELAGRAAAFTAGAGADRQRQDRHGYENFVGSQLGVRGALRRDEVNRAASDDVYAQGWWRFADRWSVLAGARHSRVRFEAEDRYVTATNPDDSGRVTHSETTPVAGITFAATDDVRLYASTGRGFETPTFNELGYRADGGAGLAFDLRPATSDNVEVGARWRSATGARVDAALFRADTDDEIAVARNVGGRSSFRNVGRARREGFELAGTLPLGEAWALSVAWTWLDARFVDGFPVCTGSGCTNPTTLVRAGARIPGTARQQAFARLQWRPAGWTFALEGSASGDMVADDAGTARAPGHVLAHLEAARDWRAGRGTLRGFARVDNLFDATYIGSVIVNEGNARYYEPGPGRGLLLGLRWQWESAP